MTRPAHTVVYTHGAGRLGNQVIRFAHWAAWATDHADTVEVLNFCFWPYASHFATWRDHPGCVFPLRPGLADGIARARQRVPEWLRTAVERKSRAARVVQSLGHVVPRWQAVDRDIRLGESIDLDDPGFLKGVTKHPVTTCCGWKIASWKRVTAHQQELRALFQPAAEYVQHANSLVSEIRRSHDVVIGVLVRQTDYRTWKGGRFYFDTQDYAEWMRQLLDLHAGRRVAFVIATDEWQDPALFDGLPARFATGAPNCGGHWFESWVQLSRCDFIVSPPSTFSATAAFLGGTPVWPLVAKGQRLHGGQMIQDGLIGASRHPEFSCSVQ